MEVATCTGCPFAGKRIVNGEGPRDAKIVIIGEAPGANEDQEGRPFVGDAGRRLNDLLQSAGIFRDECYITNALKCRPPGNDIKSPDAIRARKYCLPQLEAELRMLHPNVIVPVGNTALDAIGLHGAISHYRGFISQSTFGKTIPTFHPAYYMRNPEEWITGVYDWKKIRRHSKIAGIPQVPRKMNLYPTVEHVEQFSQGILRALDKGAQRILSLDLETYYGHFMEVPIKLIGLSIDSSEAIVVPFITESGNFYWKDKSEEIRVIEAIGDLFSDPRLPKMAFNAGFDISVAMNHGFEFNGPIVDWMIAHNLLYQNLGHSLEYVSSLYTDFPPWKQDKQQGDDTGYRTYNARDTLVLHDMNVEIMEDLKDCGMVDLFEAQCAQLIPTAHMKLTGIRIDEDRRGQVMSNLKALMKKDLEELQQESGIVDYNPNSSVQTAQVLFEKMKLKSAIHSGSGALSTKEEVLNRLMIRYPENTFVPKLLEYRKTGKLLDFIETPTLSDGKAHSDFGLTGTITGRYNSKNPNLQNLPSKKKDKGGFVRSMFVAEPGHTIVETDFSQAELRIFAALANDEVWLSAFAEGKDVHAINCDDMFGPGKREYRSYAKNFIFGFIYGSEGSQIESILPKELLATLSVPQILDNLKATHPAMFSYRDQIAQEVMITKRLRNPFGRVRWYPNNPSKEDLRTAFNYPIQSTVADMMHIKMRKVYERRENSRICLQLHDALYMMVPDEEVRRMAGIMKEIMVEPVKTKEWIGGRSFTFELPCTVEAGKDLFSMEELK